LISSWQVGAALLAAPVVWIVLVVNAARMKLRSERRAGEMLAGMDKAKGGGDQKSDHRCNNVTGDNPTLSEIGITKRQSSDWQNIHYLAHLRHYNFQIPYFPTDLI